MIFISYSWCDRGAAESVAASLRRRRWHYWLDSDRLSLDKPFDDQIVEAIRRSTRILLLDSASSRISPWVRFELCAAWALNCPVTKARVTDMESHSLWLEEVALAFSRFDMAPGAKVAVSRASS